MIALGPLSTSAGLLRTLQSAAAFSGRFRSARAVIMICLAIAILPLAGCKEERRVDRSFDVRFRWTVSVLVDGELKTASSVIQLYYWGFSEKGSAIDGHMFRVTMRGVAPVIDLGQRGTIVAALNFDASEIDGNEQKFGTKCTVRGNHPADYARPVSAGALVTAVFDLPVEKLPQAQGERIVPEKYYPVFIWFPAGQPYRSAEQLCAVEFSRVFGSAVKVESMKIEIAPNAPFTERLAISAPWLDEIRAEQVKGVYGHGRFVPNLLRQIETDYK